MRSAAYYREQAARFRVLALDSDEKTAMYLELLAAAFDAEAEWVESHQPRNPVRE